MGSLLLLLVLLWFQTVHSVATVQGVHDTGLVANSSDGRSVLQDYLDPLKLCECEKATGPPYNLSCERQGFFVAGFEREGSWVAGGGYVPLSSAICCRPCLPSELPADRSGMVPSGTKVTGIVSFGCHRSTNRPVDRLMCEAWGASLVTGFSEAVAVAGALREYYPINAVGCCTPGLLLDTGDVWQLERCHCFQSDVTINCGQQARDTLLLGFINFRVTHLGSLVPVAPAECCQLCLSEQVHRMSNCEEVGFCNGHGSCIMGSCECVDGWAGEDCKSRSSYDGGIPGWAIVLVVIGSCIALSSFMFLVARVVAFIRDRDESDTHSSVPDGSAEPLLRIGDDGSVGSEDTTDDEAEHDGGEEEALEATDEITGEGESHAPHGQHSQHARSREGQQAVLEVESLPPCDERTAGMVDEDSMLEVVTQKTADEKGGGDEGEVSGDDAELYRMNGVDCVVCMSRPVQVVIIPCGHAAMCRRCSRRISRCPICRKEILRRQRLYMGG